MEHRSSKPAVTGMMLRASQQPQTAASEARAGLGSKSGSLYAPVDD